MTTTAGSSPLARGLPHCPRGGVLDQGIIPARAGFTRSRTRRSRRWTDHPRSRGVYRDRPVRAAMSVGSSPLARGLRPYGADDGDESGIIPARAGFTRGRAPGPSPRPDHPRSRGVYDTLAASYEETKGSSPLARGLPGHCLHALPQVRIIPARAGFTDAGGNGWRGRADHPRSRGVYQVIFWSSPPRMGSSPLARGLRVAAWAAAWVAGIIPARAGFTRGPTGGGLHADHPRSRGVYAPQPPAGAHRAGSSPLARGLHVYRTDLNALAGIIPARAGFTPGRPRGRRSRADHPRSRGVYSRTSGR